MIKILDIENFQSHQHSRLEFSPGVNIFTGNSDCGKSAIMRAILWCITNSPTGDAFVSDWCKDKKGKQVSRCRVTIDKVSRIKEKDFNGYVLNKRIGKPNELGADMDEVYEALRGNVPSDISNVFNISDVNIQRQLDGPFMLSNSPGENSRMINELVNLQDIDEATSFVGSLQRSCNSELKIRQDERDSLEKKLKSFENLDGALELIPRLDELSGKIQELENEILNLMSSTKIFDELRCKAENLSARIEMCNIARMQEIQERIAEVDVPQLVDVFKAMSEDLNILEEKISACKISQLEELNRKIAEIDIPQNVNEYRAAKEFVSREGFSTLNSIVPKLERYQGIVNSLYGEVSTLTDSLGMVRSLRNEIKDSQSEADSIEKSLSGMVCPLCGHAYCNQTYRDTFR